MLLEKKLLFFVVFCLAGFKSPNIPRANLKNDTNGQNVRLASLDSPR